MFKGMVLGTGFPSQVCVHKIMVMQYCSHLLFKMTVKIWSVHFTVINMLLTFTFALFSVSLASHNHGTSKSMFYDVLNSSF